MQIGIIQREASGPPLCLIQKLHGKNLCPDCKQQLLETQLSSWFFLSHPLTRAISPRRGHSSAGSSLPPRCPVRGWMTPQRPTPRPSENRSKELVSREANNPGPLFLDLGSFLLPFFLWFSGVAPAFHAIGGTLEMT